MNKQHLIKSLRNIKSASRILANIPTDIKNKFLNIVAANLLGQKENILRKNNKDIENAIKNKLSPALIDRLTLNEKRIEQISNGTIHITKLEDPVGTVLEDRTSPNGLRIQKVRVPLGVICMVYESRPNVTVDSTALCVKSGNAVILRGGSEAINTNRILVKILKKSLLEAGLSEDIVLFIDSTDRKIIYELIKLNNLIDLVIPRGSENMINQIREKATVPVLAHGKGLCHTYIDKSANIDMAVSIAYNAKVQRPGVCNAMESLLIHKDIAREVLPKLVKLYKEAGVELRVCSKTAKILSDFKELGGYKTAKEIDWATEYLDLILSIKTVDSIEEAIEHINKYGSGHSESIVAGDNSAARKFIVEVDASAVFHNSSTRLHDGEVFGLGAEIGISTQKLHARGTMGLKELTTTKYIVYGTGQIRV